MVQFEKKWSSWIIKNKLASPPPTEAKHLVLERYHIQDAVWLETGTFKGDTTRFLAGISPRVISIEPSDFYFREATKRLSDLPNVELIKGSSQDCLERLLKKLAGKDVCLWLDGHWSGDETYCGQEETPVLSELDTIEKLQGRFPGLVVLIDDYRLCWSSPKSYPKPQYYINWAERNRLNWLVEQDIFVATKTPLPLS